MSIQNDRDSGEIIAVLGKIILMKKLQASAHSFEFPEECEVYARQIEVAAQSRLRRSNVLQLLTEWKIKLSQILKAHFILGLNKRHAKPTRHAVKSNESST